jgi:hypothetical protein
MPPGLWAGQWILRDIIFKTEISQLKSSSIEPAGVKLLKEARKLEGLIVAKKSLVKIPPELGINIFLCVLGYILGKVKDSVISEQQMIV